MPTYQELRHTISPSLLMPQGSLKRAEYTRVQCFRSYLPYIYCLQIYPTRCVLCRNRKQAVIKGKEEVQLLVIYLVLGCTQKGIRTIPFLFSTLYRKLCLCFNLPVSITWLSQRLSFLQLFVVQQSIPGICYVVGKRTTPCI